MELALALYGYFAAVTVQTRRGLAAFIENRTARS